MRPISILSHVELKRIFCTARQPSWQITPKPPHQTNPEKFQKEKRKKLAVFLAFFYYSSETNESKEIQNHHLVIDTRFGLMGCAIYTPNASANVTISAFAKHLDKSTSIGSKKKTRVFKMNNKVGDDSEGAMRKRFRCERWPIPKRGQIKSRIAASAIHSIVSVLSRASSERKRPRRTDHFKRDSEH